jgi:two-component system OmpR family sensor kinase
MRVVLPLRAVSTGKLTRQELGWLLTQEAQGAAERLRTGVQFLKSNVPPPLDPTAEGGMPPVDATLDALDEAMRMLSTIHKVPSSGRGRRGRIDLASLLWEVAPEARVSIEPGGGTEISGDEAEIRRMMHLLVGHGSGAGSAVTVRRDGDEVRVSVVLGPDSGASAETERAWLSRMAIRYGGKYDLEGGMEVISLPADGAIDAKERDLLRKELDEARKQGEAYARELAQAFALGEGAVSPSTFPPPMSQGSDNEPITALVRFSGGLAAELRGLLSQIGRDVQALRGTAASGSNRSLEAESDDRVDALKRRVRDTQELVAELAGLGEIDPIETHADLDLVELTRAASRSLAALLERTGVDLTVATVPDVADLKAPIRLSPRAATYLVRTLIAQAITATPRGEKVLVTVVAPTIGSAASGHGSSGTTLPVGAPVGGGARLIVDDAGASLPATARKAFVGLEVEPSTYGRQSSVSLFICSEVASWQGCLLELGDAPLGGLRVGLHLPRVGSRPPST